MVKELTLYNIEDILNLLDLQIPLLSDTFRCYGVYESDSLVSVSFLSIFNICPNDEAPSGLVGEISGVFTKSEYRNRGYARLCVESCLLLGKEMNLDYITIDAVNTAKVFYEKIGFIYLDSSECRMYIKL